MISEKKRGILFYEELFQQREELYYRLGKVKDSFDNTFIPIQFSGFKDIYIRNESFNPTGTHKDRLALKVIDLYLKCIYSRMARNKYQDELPHFSLISAGNAAIAIGSILKEYKLPQLKVLVDEQMDEMKVNNLQRWGCQVYKTNLQNKCLSSDDILSLTQNSNGVDLTFFSGQCDINNAYQALSVAILAMRPDVVIVPYGTGGLFSTICNMVWSRFETLASQNTVPDNTSAFFGCSVIGVTVNDRHSKADKLYCPFSPFDNNYQRVNFFKNLGVLNEDSNINFIEDDFIDQALEIFDVHNIKAEPSGAAALAYLISNANELNKELKYILVNTGKGVLEEQEINYWQK